MDTITRNFSTSFNNVAQPGQIPVVVAGRLFLVDYLFTKDEPIKGKCNTCKKVIDVFQDLQNNKLDGDTLTTIERLRIEEIQYKNKGYTKTTIDSACPFVKKLYATIITAVRKRAAIGKKFCEKDKPGMSEDIIIWGSGSKPKKFIDDVNNKIETLW